MQQNIFRLLQKLLILNSIKNFAKFFFQLFLSSQNSQKVWYLYILLYYIL